MHQTKEKNINEVRKFIEMAEGGIVVIKENKRLEFMGKKDKKIEKYINNITDFMEIDGEMMVVSDNESMTFRYI